MNKAILSGRLTRDPELKTTQNQVEVCSFTVAVDRKFKNKDGERGTDFIPCVAWRSTAEFISRYFSKGSRIELCGSIQTRTYDDNDGKRVYVTEIAVDEVGFGDSKSQSASGSVQPDMNVTRTEQHEPIQTLVPPEDLPFDL